MKPTVIVCLLLSAAPAAFAACPESMNRDPTYVTLAVDEKTPRPTSAEDFKFIDDTTTLDDLTRKVGSPDAAKGIRTFFYCLADGTVVTVTTHTGTDIKTQLRRVQARDRAVEIQRLVALEPIAEELREFAQRHRTLADHERDRRRVRNTDAIAQVARA